MRTRTFVIAAAACALVAGLGPGAAVAGVTGQIKTTGGRTLQGDVRWQGVSRSYAVTYGNPPVTVTVSLGDVADVRVQKPRGIDEAVLNVQRRNYAEAIPVLTKIMSDYEMLQWDVTAARFLAEAYLKTGKLDEAMRVCDRILQEKPDQGITGELARVYWDVLLALDRTATLQKLLDEAVARGNRELAATALVMRGDIQLKNGNFEDALVDGYLRVVTLYQEEQKVQPEALYKAMKCFEQRGQLSHAEKMRKTLLNNFPNDPHAQRVRSGA